MQIKFGRRKVIKKLLHELGLTFEIYLLTACTLGSLTIGLGLHVA